MSEPELVKRRGQSEARDFQATFRGGGASSAGAEKGEEGMALKT